MIKYFSNTLMSFARNNQKPQPPYLDDTCVHIQDAPIFVRTWGKRIDEPLNDCKEMIVCFPGNAGLLGFYTKFLDTIFKELSHKLPIWIIGHAGYDENLPNIKVKVPRVKNHEQMYDIDAQLNYKREFILQYVPESTKIHFIGHSQGAWFLYELLKYAEIKNRVKRCYLLFPAIERLEDTQTIHSIRSMFEKYETPLRISLFLYNSLPYFMKSYIMRRMLRKWSIDEDFVDTCCNFMRVEIMDICRYIGYQLVSRANGELDSDYMKENMNFLKLYYGVTDHWIPKENYYKLKENYPGIDAQLDDEHMIHAFVLKSSIRMGQKVANWIKEENNRESNEEENKTE